MSRIGKGGGGCTSYPFNPRLELPDAAVWKAPLLGGKLERAPAPVAAASGRRRSGIADQTTAPPSPRLWRGRLRPPLQKSRLPSLPIREIRVIRGSISAFDSLAPARSPFGLGSMSLASRRLYSAIRNPQSAIRDPHSAFRIRPRRLRRCAIATATAPIAPPIHVAGSGTGTNSMSVGL